MEHAPFPDAACSGEALRKSWTQPPTTNLWLWIKADCCDTVAPPSWCCWCRCWTGQLTTAACDPALGLAWDWSEDARQCGASHVSQPALQRLLAGKWVVVAGDSVGRFFFAALLRQLTSDGEKVERASARMHAGQLCLTYQRSRTNRELLVAFHYG